MTPAGFFVCYRVAASAPIDTMARQHTRGAQSFASRYGRSVWRLSWCRGRVRWGPQFAAPRPRFRFAPHRASLLLPPLPLSSCHTSLPTLPALSRARPSYTGAPLPPHPRGSLRSRLRDPSPLTPDALAGCPCFGGRALRSCVMTGDSSCVALASHHAEAPSRSRILQVRDRATSTRAAFIALVVAGSEFAT